MAVLAHRQADIRMTGQFLSRLRVNTPPGEVRDERVPKPVEVALRDKLETQSGEQTKTQTQIQTLDERSTADVR